MKRTTIAIAAAAAASVALLAAAFYLWRKDATAPAVAFTPAPAAAAPSAPPLAAPEAQVHYPIEATLAASAPSARFDLQAEMTDLFGLRTVQSLFRLEDFSRRLAATVDNLGRSSASASRWPMQPASGRFTVEERDGSVFIGTDNNLRYAPYVLLLETVNLPQAASLYARIYPSLQKSYEELGYPKGYFNDRLVEVIDLLLATPETDAPLQVRMPPINGPVRPARPWVLYEFADPSLEALSSGQKVLLRMGVINERRVKARLAEFRRLVTTPRPRR